MICYVDDYFNTNVKDSNNDELFQNETNFDVEAALNFVSSWFLIFGGVLRVQFPGRINHAQKAMILSAKVSKISISRCICKSKKFNGINQRWFIDSMLLCTYLNFTSLHCLHLVTLHWLQKYWSQMASITPDSLTVSFSMVCITMCFLGLLVQAKI